MSTGGPGRGGVRRRAFLDGLLLAIGGATVPALFPSCPGAHAPGSSPHPYLFFGAGDLDAIRARCAASMRPQLDRLLQHAREHLDETPPQALARGQEEKGDQIQAPFLAYILDFSFLHVVTAEARYLDAARRWTLGLARMPDLVEIVDVAGGKRASAGYPEGWAAIALAAAYDWLYPHFAEDDRALLRETIGLLSRALYEATFAGEWWTGAYLHHDTWIPLGGLGVGAMSILDEVPEAQTWAERAAHEIATALDWLDADGAWPEGPCGWAFALASVVPFWDAYRRRFPDRGRAILDDPWLANTWRFRLYSRTPDGRFLGFGDCREHGGYQTSGYEGGPVLRWLAARYRCPYAQWAAAREWETRPNPFTAVWEILWCDPGVGEAAPDDLPRGALFDNQAMAFLRTGWDAGATVLAFRAGSLLGRRAMSLFRPEKRDEFNNSTTHVHADANSFGIWSRGDFAVTMASYGQRETELHNSLRVNGRGQYSSYGADHPGRPDGRITGFFSSDHGAFVAGEAASAYPPGLERFSRRMYLIEPGIVFLHDDIAATEPAELEWRIHVDRSAAVDLGRDGFESVVAGRRTVFRLARPRGLRFDQLADRWNRAVAMTLEGRVREAQLVAVILPSLPADARSVIDTPSESSFVIDALGVTVVAAFSAAPAALEIPGRLEAHGSAAIAWRRGDTTGLLAVDCTRFVLDGECLFESPAPVAFSCSRTEPR